MKQAKINALAEYLDGENITIETAVFKNHFETSDGREYLVLTNREADKATAEYIRETVWAFRPEWLAEQTGLPKEIFEALKDQCESSNDAILRVIEDFDSFVEESIKADGRGHFLAGYDFVEGEQGDFFIYRTN